MIFDELDTGMRRFETSLDPVSYTHLEEANNSVIGQGDLKMDTESRRVFIGEREINLTAKEFDLLELLVRNPNKVYSREALLTYV